MAQKIKAGKKSEIGEGSPKIIEAAGKQIAVINSGGKFYAILNVCAHEGGPVGEGFVTGDAIMCPWHAWEYDLKTGKSITMPGKGIQTFKVVIQGDDIFVEV